MVCPLLLFSSYVRGDLVSVLQDSIFADTAAAILASPVKYAIGIASLMTGQTSFSDVNLTVGSVPEAFGKRRLIEPADLSWGMLTRHSNTSVLRSLGQQTLSLIKP